MPATTRYLELHPNGMLDIVIMSSLSTAVALGYIPMCSPYVRFVQIGCAVASGHLTGQYVDYNMRMRRRNIFQQITRRPLIKIKGSVRLRDAVAYLYGTLAFVLQKLSVTAKKIDQEQMAGTRGESPAGGADAAGRGGAGAAAGVSARLPPSSSASNQVLLSTRDIQKQARFLEGLCDSIDPEVWKFDPFPRELSTPQHAVAACVFIFEQWQLHVKNYARRVLHSPAGMGLFFESWMDKEERRCLAESIRALAAHTIWRREDLWKRSMLLSRLCLLFLAVLDVLLQRQHVFDAFLLKTSPFVDGRGLNLLHCTFEEKVKRCLAVLKHLLALNREQLWREEAVKNHAAHDRQHESDATRPDDPHREEHDDLLDLLLFSRQVFAGNSSTSEDTTSREATSQQAQNEERSEVRLEFNPVLRKDEQFLARYFGALQDAHLAQKQFRPTLHQLFYNDEMGRRLREGGAAGSSYLQQSLLRQKRNDRTKPMDILLKKVWSTPLPDAPMVIRNWSPCVVGARIYRLGESPLDRDPAHSGSGRMSYFFAGLPAWMRMLMDPVPLTQTRIKPNSEWIIRPPSRKDVIQAGGKRGRTTTGDSAAENRASASSAIAYSNQSKHQTRKKGGKNRGDLFEESNWDPLAISPTDYEFELIIFSMDGIVLDEYVLSRGETYDFDVERPPRPPATISQYRPPQAALKNIIATSQADARSGEDHAASHDGDLYQASQLRRRLHDELVELGEVESNNVHPRYPSKTSSSSYGNYDDAATAVVFTGSSKASSSTSKVTSSDGQHTALLGGVSSRGTTKAGAHSTTGRLTPRTTATGQRQGFFYYPEEVAASAAIAPSTSAPAPEHERKKIKKERLLPHSSDEEDEIHIQETNNYGRDHQKDHVLDDDSAQPPGDYTLRASVVKIPPSAPTVARRWRRLPPRVLLESFPNWPEYTLCPKCFRQMDATFGCRSLPRELYFQGVDCNCCAAKRLDVNPEYLDQNGSFCRYEEIPPTMAEKVGAAVANVGHAVAAAVGSLLSWNKQNDPARRGGALAEDVGEQLRLKKEPGSSAQATHEIKLGETGREDEETDDEDDSWSEYDTKEYSFSHIEDREKQGDSSSCMTTSDVQQSVFHLRSDILTSTMSHDNLNLSSLVVAAAGKRTGGDSKKDRNKAQDENNAAKRGKAWQMTRKRRRNMTSSSMLKEKTSPLFYEDDGAHVEVDEEDDDELRFDKTRKLLSRLVRPVVRRLIPDERSLEKNALLPRPDSEQENQQPFFHCPRCNFDLCKPCAVQQLREHWWKE
ncbi:unnamed protein product [Amoebophrya sp. A25]|nr:unnamed protein product [Amoebophrya sp. A25]|eukprot:GSA25T00015688001.1